MKVSRKRAKIGARAGPIWHFKAHGASAKNVISETMYITGWQFIAEGGDIRRAFYVDAKAAFPTAAGVQVVALADPALVLEVEIVALPGRLGSHDLERATRIRRDSLALNRKEQHPGAFEEAKAYEKAAVAHGSPFTCRA